MRCVGTARNRFRTEAEAIARLYHPNIVQIHEVGEHDGLPFFSLEFCLGGSLERKLAATPLPSGEAATLVETLAWAMQAAHDKGVLPGVGVGGGAAGALDDGRGHPLRGVVPEIIVGVGADL
jgi:serine/threonine protein kinase